MNRYDKVEDKIVDKMRSQMHIAHEYHRLWDKVWWNRHMSRHRPGKDCNSEELTGCDPARDLEKKYGREFLDPGEQVEWGITQGKMMALAWVLGSEWDGSGDT